MIGLLAPLGLAALAAMLVPLLIHLLRRPEDRVLPFAAWRYLVEPARPRERSRLRHWLLLVLRLLLIAVIALLLSQLVWYRDAEPTPAMTVAWPGAAADAATPSLDPREPASALRQIDAELSPGAALTVQVPEVLDGLDAERLRLSRDVGWQIQAGGGAAALAAALRVAVRSDDEAQRATAQAVIDAWRSAGRAIVVDAADLSAPIASDTDLLFQLGGELDAAKLGWLRRGGRALVAAPDDATDTALSADAADAVQRLGSGRWWRWPGTFDASRDAALRDATLPSRLGAVLLPDLALPAYAASVAPLNGARAGRAPGDPLDPFLLLIAAALFAAERALAAGLSRR